MVSFGLMLNLNKLIGIRDSLARMGQRQVGPISVSRKAAVVLDEELVSEGLEPMAEQLDTQKPVHRARMQFVLNEEEDSLAIMKITDGKDQLIVISPANSH